MHLDDAAAAHLTDMTYRDCQGDRNTIDAEPSMQHSIKCTSHLIKSMRYEVPGHAIKPMRSPAMQLNPWGPRRGPHGFNHMAEAMEAMADATAITGELIGLKSPVPL